MVHRAGDPAVARDAAPPSGCPRAARRRPGRRPPRPAARRSRRRRAEASRSAIVRRCSAVADAQQDELRRTRRREADEDDDVPESRSAWVIVPASQRTKYASCGVRPAKAPARNEPVQERADAVAQLGPQRVAVGLEDRPPGAAVDALLEEDRQPADRDVLPLRVAVRRQRARAPDQRARAGEAADGVDAHGEELLLLGAVSSWATPVAPASAPLAIPAGAAHDVGACVDAGDGARRRDRLAVHDQPRPVGGGERAADGCRRAGPPVRRRRSGRSRGGPRTTPRRRSAASRR